MDLVMILLGGSKFQSILEINECSQWVSTEENSLHVTSLHVKRNVGKLYKIKFKTYCSEIKNKSLLLLHSRISSITNRCETFPKNHNFVTL